MSEKAGGVPVSAEERLAALLHEHEMAGLMGQGPLPWQDCVEAEDHRSLAARLIAAVPTEPGAPDPLRAQDAFIRAANARSRTSGMLAIPHYRDVEAIWKAIEPFLASQPVPAPEPSARPGSGAKYGDPAEEWSNGFLAGERYARQAAREPSARLDVERMARAIAAWGYEPTVVYRADMKEPTDAQCRMARKIANQYAALAATPQDPRGMSRGFRGTNQRAGLEYSWASRPVPASEPSARLLAAARAVVAAVVDDESGMQTFDFALIDDLGDALDDLEA